MPANGQCINETTKNVMLEAFFLSICLSPLTVYSVALPFWSDFSLSSFVSTYIWIAQHCTSASLLKKNRKIFTWLRLFPSDSDDALSLLINCFNSFILFYFLAIGRVHISHCFRSACVFVRTMLFFFFSLIHFPSHFLRTYFLFVLTLVIFGREKKKAAFVADEFGVN